MLPFDQRLVKDTATQKLVQDFTIIQKLIFGMGLQVAALIDPGTRKMLRLGMEKNRLMISTGDRPMEGLPD